MKQNKIKVIRLDQVQARLGLAKGTIYLKLKEDSSFPKPINLGGRAVGWIESEIDEWLVERIKVRDHKEKINNFASALELHEKEET